MGDVQNDKMDQVRRHHGSTTRLVAWSAEGWWSVDEELVGVGDTVQKSVVRSSRNERKGGRGEGELGKQTIRDELIRARRKMIRQICVLMGYARSVCLWTGKMLSKMSDSRLV